MIPGNHRAGRNLRPDRKPLKVFSSHLLRCNGPSDPLHLVNIAHGIHFLDVHRIDVTESKRIESFARQFGIITNVGDQLGNVPNFQANHIPNF